MKKILPGLYKGRVKNTSQNQKQSIFSINDEKVVSKSNDSIEEMSINKKIKDIFNSPNYVYRADVSITTTDGESLKKTIIGRTNNSLITLDDELIDVSKISKIDFLN